jgi:hypothetical protein
MEFIIAFKEGATVLGVTMSNPNQPNTNSKDDLAYSLTKSQGVVACVDPLDPTSFKCPKFFM